MYNRLIFKNIHDKMLSKHSKIIFQTLFNNRQYSRCKVKKAKHKIFNWYNSKYVKKYTYVHREKKGTKQKC